ncbi:MAG: alpha/beta fold hydrolase [Ardenticatenaceae bacterium]|nr:alpha/beta fold hydrolase [Ardenticatenaceae bacterium]
MKNVTLKFINTLFFLLGLIYVGGSLFFANVLINRDTQTLADSQQRMADLDYHAAALPKPEAISIEAGTVTLSGFFYDNDKNGRCAVLLLHGYTNTRYSILPYAPLFWDRGCDLLTYDARGHGESTDAYHTYGYHEKLDGQAAYEWLLTQTGLPEASVGILGVSYGASTALQMVPLLPEAAFVIADSPYQDLRTIVAHQAVEQFGAWTRPFVPGAFFIAELRANFDADDVSPQDAVAGATTPILLIHAQADTFTPPSHSQTIYARSNPATTELHLTAYGTSHGRSILDDYESYKGLVDAFLADKVPGFGIGD